MTSLAKKTLNWSVLAVFAPVLILTGALGFVLPEGPMSSAPAYNIFHMVFGALGLVLVLRRREGPIRMFNIGFGLIDLYQAAASMFHWWPIDHFRWKTGDDVLHVVIGLALVLVGLSRRR